MHPRQRMLREGNFAKANSRQDQRMDASQTMLLRNMVNSEMGERPSGLSSYLFFIHFNHQMNDLTASVNSATFAAESSALVPQTPM